MGTPVGGPYERLTKPVIDWVLGGLLAILLVAVIGLVALAVWGTMGGPVLLRQQRVGQHGAAFKMYKFRSMLPDRRVASDRWTQPRPFAVDRRACHKSKDDPRITPLGRFLRSWSLDELPRCGMWYGAT